MAYRPGVRAGEAGFEGREEASQNNLVTTRSQILNAHRCYVGFQGGGRGGAPSGPQPEPVALPPAVIDARLTDHGLDQVTQGLAKLKIQGGGGELSVRPGFGTLGKAVKLRANYFPVLKFPALLHEYAVKVSFFLAYNLFQYSGTSCITVD